MTSEAWRKRLGVEAGVGGPIEEMIQDIAMGETMLADQSALMNEMVDANRKMRIKYDELASAAEAAVAWWFGPLAEANHEAMEALRVLLGGKYPPTPMPALGKGGG